MKQKTLISILIAVLTFTLILLMVLTTLLRKPKQAAHDDNSLLSPPVETITTVQQTRGIQKSKTIQNIPTYTPDKGTGLDIDSPVAKASESEIAKLYPFLPYEQTITLRDDSEVSFLIPQKDYQDNTWSLLINVYGVDFQVPQDSTSYTTQKTAFLQVVTSATNWIKTQGADPAKMVILWGDRAFIQNRAEEWLEN